MRMEFSMPRPRKYNYEKGDFPDTIFITVPYHLKENIEQIMTKKELNDLLTKFLIDFLKDSKNNG